MLLRLNITMFTATIWIVLLASGLLNCLQIVPERANVTYENTKYVENVKLYVSRHGRKSPYYINLEGVIKQPWTNNVTVDLVFFEYLHNEYRRSFVEMHFKFCDLINSDPYIGGMLMQNGVRCPSTPGEYHLMNMTVPTESFPNVIPFSKAKVEAEIATNNKADTIFRAYVKLSMIAKKKKTS